MAKRNVVDEHQVQIMERLLVRGRERYRASLVATISFLLSAVFVALIALFGELHFVFYISAGILLVAAIRSWLNMRDMEHFINVMERDLHEIRK